MSIRVRIIGAFILLFLLMSGITVTAVVLISEFSVRLRFVEKIEKFASEIQRARHFEKSFFLSGTSLADALASVHTARNCLVLSADDMLAVAGQERYSSMKENLSLYENLLEELLATGAGRSDQKVEYRQIETRLRKYGAQILSDARDMNDRERQAVHSTLSTSVLAAVAFLVFMFFIMAYITNFIVRAVLKPLGHFRRYAERIGAGDYSPITPVSKYRDEFSNLAVVFNQMLVELRGRQEQLVQAGKMAAVGTLTSGIAHELNNPLNNIGITTESLIAGFDSYSDEEKLKMLDQIYTQVERASGTVRNLLDFARDEQPVFTSVSVRQVLESTIKLVSSELSLGGIEASLELENGLPAVWGNSRSLQQVFLNLFLNSIQAMPDGGKLSVRAESDNGFVRVNVTDSGVGIPNENLDRLFDPFFTTSETGQGTGLGLSVSYGIVEKHKGKITIESEAGEGTTFSVFLPIRKDQ